MAWQYPRERLSLLQGLDAAHHLPVQSPGRLPASVTLSKTSLYIYSSAAQDDTWPQPRSYQGSPLRDVTAVHREGRLTGRPAPHGAVPGQRLQQERLSGPSRSGPRGLRPYQLGHVAKAGGRPIVSVKKGTGDKCVPSDLRFAGQEPTSAHLNL